MARHEGQDPEITRAIFDTLSAIDRLSERHQELARSTGARGSQRLADEARSAGLGHEVWDLAMDQIASGIDHLIAWRALIEAGVQPAFAHLTLLRGAMEAAVTARWLLAGTSPTSGSAAQCR